MLSYYTPVDGSVFNVAGMDAIKDGRPAYEALSTHADIPNIACCKLEEWPKRTHMRYKKSIADFVTRICADTSKVNVSLTCQAATAL